MKEDPLVEEIHEVRRKLLDDCGGDLERLMDRLQSRERQDPERVVSDLGQVKASLRSSH